MTAWRLKFKTILFSGILVLAACADNDTESKSSGGESFTEITWDDLLPDNYSPETIFKKYEKELELLNKLGDNSPQAIKIFKALETEFNKAPANKKLDGKKIRLAGFIAPLENQEGKITEFLLVPYFGACIHSPPPPVNQTVLVKADPESAIDSEDYFAPHWIYGAIKVSAKKTALGGAGYVINDAMTEIYE